jgi:hypothetical protein
VLVPEHTGAFAGYHYCVSGRKSVAGFTREDTMLSTYTAIEWTRLLASLIFYVRANLSLVRSYEVLKLNISHFNDLALT